MVSFFNVNECILMVIVKMGRDGQLCVLSTYGVLQLSDFASWPPLLVITQISFKNATLGKLDIGHINISEFLALSVFMRMFLPGVHGDKINLKTG